MRADERLAVYGTLAPGRENYHMLESLSGTWSRGTVRGSLHPEGWGATHGYPAIVLDDDGGEVEVFILESRELPAHWARLDEFEGSEYKRAIAKVRNRQNEVIECCIYVLNQDQEAKGKS